MNPRATVSLSSLFFLLLSSATTAFNITQLLGQYPEFSTFNGYLNQTQLYTEINRRKTITVLAVENSAVSSIAGRPMEVMKKILSLHVVLHYYDLPKLKKISKKSTLLTTLYQSTGLALRQQGLLNVTKLSGGEIAFRSAVNGSNLHARLVNSVAVQPNNISVLEISSVIIAPGIGEVVMINSALPPAVKEAPSPDADADADTDVEAPEAESPDVDVEAPESETSSAAPEPPQSSSEVPEPPDEEAAPEPSSGPASSHPLIGAADAAPTPSPSSSSRVVFSACLLLLIVVMGMLVSSLFGF